MKRGAGYLALFAFLVTGLRFTTGPAGLREASAVQAQQSLPPMPPTFLREETTCHAFEYPAEAPPKGAQPKDGSASAGAAQTSSKYGEIARLVDRFFYRPAQSTRPSADRLPRDTRLMIATVPDPRHTHLSLQFDRTLEAVQQAAQDEGYIYDSSWLPWKAERIAYGSLSDRTAEMKETAERELCPGLVAFRRSPSLRMPARENGAAAASDCDPYACGLFVFIVGEEPTAGLNRVQWENALRWIDRHAYEQRPDMALRVLGPNFSGSMPSFVRALKDVATHTIDDQQMQSGKNIKAHASTFTSTLLYSGRISGCLSWHWLEEQLNPTGQNLAPPLNAVSLPVRLADFEQNDALQANRLYRYLKDRGQQLKEVAILSEDETAYGGLPDVPGTGTNSARETFCNPGYSNNDRPVHLYYPRDISALRSAYEEQSMFGPAQKSEAPAGQAHTVLRPESKAPVDEAVDTITPFSGPDLALTQEAQLYGIVSALKTHGIRYIVLRSTNSLDFLFLTRFMHRAYPNAYIITTGSDLLFGREVDSTEFRGVVSLSSYPLLPRGQDWTRQIENAPQHAHRVFGANTMEGGYLAARFLISDPGAAPGETSTRQPLQAKADIPDYAPPFWQAQAGAGSQQAEPVTWLSVIGRDGYWPLATLTATLNTTPASSTIEPVTRHQEIAAANRKASVGPQYLELTGSWRFVCVLVLVMFAVHRFACRYGWDRLDLAMFVQFAPMSGRRGPGMIAAGWTAICSMLLILFLTCLRMWFVMKWADKIWVFIMGGVTVAACWYALVEVRWWNAPGGPDSKKPSPLAKDQLRFYRIVTACMFAGIVLLGGVGWLILGFDETGSIGLLTAYRSVHMASGVSPLIPLMALLMGFYWWFWHSLSGLALLGPGRPVLPRSKWERERDQASGKHGDNLLARSIEQAALPFPTFGKSTLMLYLLPLFLVILISVVLQKAWMKAFDMILHSLENTAYNRTLHVIVAILLYLIFLECLQFYSTWLVLKRLLKALDRLPLRRTFASLQGLSMRSLWRLSGAGSRARAKIFSRQMESLGHFKQELDECGWLGCGTPELRQSVQSTLIEGCTFITDREKGDIKDLATLNTEEAKNIRVVFGNCAELVLEDLLRPEWKREHSPLDAAQPKDDGPDNLKLSDNLAVRAGEEFICLTYVGYLQNMLGRMRTMVMSMAGLFAAIALAVGFYPFTPRPTISFSLLFLLLVIGTVVGVVFAGLDRDSTLSHITNTEPGTLGAHFWLRMVSFIGVPAMGLIVSQFPEITDFVFGWIQPTMNAVK